MIRRGIVRSFKKFDLLEFELQQRAVIAGPNNSGKTTLLQAVAAWSELGEIWLENGADLVRTDGSFSHANMDITEFRTLALSSFDELWHHQDTREPVSIRMVTDRWDVGFELRYTDPATATVRPSRETSEDSLEAYAENPLKALYIPSLSGLDIHEPEYGERVLATRLAHGKGGTVVRNMVQAASRDGDKWQTLQKTVGSFFGYELSMPSGADPIMVRYRHSPEERWYDLVNGAAGFLQTVLLQSALLHSDATLFLVDEPDAHLHVLLKEKVYRLLREHCEERGCQAVIATHSGRLIEEAAGEDGQKLFVVTAAGLNPVKPGDAKKLLRTPGEHIVQAETFQRVLYVEGKSDRDILREWARILDHPALRHLEEMFWVPTAEESGRNFSAGHFGALRAQVPALKGLEVRDRNGRGEASRERRGPGNLEIDEGEVPDGMKRVFWTRYEIENYLIHPKAMLRFLSRSPDQEVVERARNFMEEQWPRVLFERPFESSEFDGIKGKSLVSRVLTEAGLELGEAEYYRIAREMKKEEVHPDVAAMLDLIESQLKD